MNKYFAAAVVTTLPLVASADAISDITAAVDFATVVTGIGVVGLALAGVAIAMKGARLILRFIK